VTDGSRDQQPIIIKRRKKRHGGHHGGAWKVALADFMTAMMAFFLVMWLVGQKPEVRESVAGYFRDPGKFQARGGSGFLKGTKSPVVLEDKTEGITKKDKSGGGGPTDAEKKRMSTAAKKILNELKKQAAFAELRKNIKIQLTAEGLRIILNESENSPAFFEPGSRKLLQKSAIILITIARELGTLENKLVIEGHTDASFAGTGAYSNWELSSDRANSARALMEVSGLWKGQLRDVRGFADRFPMIVDNPNDRRNRRISLVVLYKSRETYYDQLAVGSDLMDEIL
jgi:chemotaxis protein MotB